VNASPSTSAVRGGPSQPPFVPRSVAAVFPIRMLALDIDGTLVGEELVLGERTRAAIVRAVQLGLRVSLVTGRTTASALAFARLLELRDPIVGLQGAAIREMSSRGSDRPGRLLRHQPLAAEVARRVIEWSRRAGLDPHIDDLDRLIFRADDPRVDDYSAFVGTRGLKVQDLVAWTTKPVSKIVAVADPPLPMEALAAARREFEGRAIATVAHPRFLEFVAPGVSKGQAVRWLARRQGVPLGQVLAIGDQVNDVEMLSSVGHGAVMPSAPDVAIASARYLAPPLEAEGAAEVIEALVLAPEGKARVAAATMEQAASDARDARAA
jgi:Cof subfamily protein (haloacid dehalogenase superfamily)